LKHTDIDDSEVVQRSIANLFLATPLQPPAVTAKLFVTSVSRIGNIGNNYQVDLDLRCSGSLLADNISVKQAIIAGGAFWSNASNLPSYDKVPATLPGGVRKISLTFSSFFLGPGNGVVLTVLGTYNNGAFGTTARFVLP
jgi:hypothetical protein